MKLKKKLLWNIVRNQIIRKSNRRSEKEKSGSQRNINIKTFNENNIANNNVDDTWKTAKANQSNNVNNKVNNKIFNSIDVSSNYQPIFMHENKVTEPHINNRMNNDVGKYKNAFNNNIGNNVTPRKRRPTPVNN